MPWPVRPILMLLCAQCILACRPVEPMPSAEADFLARCRAAAEYSRANGGEVMLVVRDGVPVFEDAIDGFTVDSPHLLASGTKSFSGIAAAIAVDDGLLSFDERVSDTITEWKSDPRKAAITVRQLLSLTSGLESLGSATGRPGSTSRRAVNSPIEVA